MRIELDNVSLTFRVRKHSRITLKEFLVQQMYRQSVNPIMKVHALKNINLKIGQGERIGIIGHNGAGKSTMLKLLAGIYPPTRGKLTVEGKICSLFDLALGFEPEASGHENIYYRGYLQGETPRTILSKMKSIADFSELGDFLNVPVRYYSAGMIVRLAFSIATAIEPEILLVDEVLGVGDMSFQEKARQRIMDIMNKAQIIVLVSHDLTTLAKICNRGIWMDHGQIREIGPMTEMVEAYKASVSNNQSQAA